MPGRYGLPGSLSAFLYGQLLRAGKDGLCEPSGPPGGQGPGNRQSTDKFHVHYKLTAQDGAPLPAGAEGNCLEFSVQGTGSYVLSWDQMPGEGSYRYELRVSGSDAAQLQSSPDRLQILIRVSDEYGAEAAVYLSDGKKGDLFFSHTCLQKTPETKGGGKTNPSVPGQKRQQTPKTGDETNMIFYFLLMGISAAFIIAALLLKKNKNIERKKHSKADH